LPLTLLVLLEVHRFNRELRNLGAPEFDWNCYRGASGLEMNCRPISISEKGRLLGVAKIRSHSMWPPDVPRSQRRPGDCQRIYRRGEFEEALRRAIRETETEPAPTLRLIKS
jgi:hypothetical protein